MNFQQLEYIVALDTHAHFAKAAKACYISQPTLSMMIQKLEEELGCRIFNRGKHPIRPTAIGKLLIEQARIILNEKSIFENIPSEQEKIVEGVVHLGIIPTLAPYLIPLFIQDFLEKHPKITVKITESTTTEIINQLKKGSLDIGILITPLQDKVIVEQPLFYESFVVYTNHDYKKEYLLPNDIDPKELWLLEEGHCLRSQIMNLCELQKQNKNRLQYASGSIEALKRLVDTQSGVTILPELATLNLPPEQQQMLKNFKDPAPVREVSIVTFRDYAKKGIIRALTTSILEHIPTTIRERASTERVSIF